MERINDFKNEKKLFYCARQNSYPEFKGYFVLTDKEALISYLLL
jgi:hypothetical protein